jgi:hypothetical protein
MRYRRPFVDYTRTMDMSEILNILQPKSSVAELARVKAWRAKNPDKVRRYKRTWCLNNLDKVRAAKKRWVMNNREKFRAAQKLIKLRIPHKIKARRKLYYAVKTGVLERGVCEVCGADNPEGHHANYSNPLRVRWLCRKHHNDLHRVQRASN